jgi:uncharacterized protein YyaL (SSP411 family)
MSVFLTPDGRPFYGGTYFPPTPRYGMPAFTDILQAAAKAWQEERGELQGTALKLSQHLDESIHWDAPGGMTPRDGVIEQAAQALLTAYSWQHGGWGRAPLFPQPMSVEFLLLQATRGNRRALEAARHTLHAMERGGMYDVVGGGFHRYSTDAQWLVPHFEKMLYDNAQLSLAYLHAYLVTREANFRRTCEETLDFILRELAHPDGGFYSSLDADSEGEEGRYYIWNLDELSPILSSTGTFDLFKQVYDLTPPGNFEDKIVLRRRGDDEELSTVLGLDLPDYLQALSRGHQALRSQRTGRVRPATDDKILVSWNALALRAFAEAARYLDRDDYLAAARKNADFLLRELTFKGRLMRSWRAGRPHHDAYLEDYAALILGLDALYQSDPDPRWYTVAEQLTQEMIAQYRDPAGGFFDTRQDAPALFIHPKDSQDNATPCGNSLAAMALLQMSEYSPATEWRELAEKPLAALQDNFVRHPAAFGMWLQGLDFYAGPVRQVALVGGSSDPGLIALKKELWKSYRPRLVAAASTFPPPAGSPALLDHRPLLGGLSTAYVCQGFTCRLPVSTPAELVTQLDDNT